MDKDVENLLKQVENMWKVLKENLYLLLLWKIPETPQVSHNEAFWKLTIDGFQYGVLTG
jgi:hypothetical protein